MTFSPDGGAGAKVREQLKSSGPVLWGLGVSTLNVIPICLLLGERQQGKKKEREREKHNRLARVRTICDQKHLCNIYAVLASALGRWATFQATSRNAGVFWCRHTNRWPQAKKNCSFGLQQRATDDLMIISHSAIIYMGIWSTDTQYFICGEALVSTEGRIAENIHTSAAEGAPQPGGPLRRLEGIIMLIITCFMTHLFQLNRR